MNITRINAGRLGHQGTPTPRPENASLEEQETIRQLHEIAEGPRCSRANQVVIHAGLALIVRLIEGRS